ncbi:ExeM/NucH family extracellular endonuclease [Frigoribacterium sp. 2-23]|uniref:ExeM/NucH family extracellular endonuclease n=1 Tax=Frigoribacterium sp. 2-23 TaxID=3415006 RepID=UPI003C6F4ADD
MSSRPRSLRRTGLAAGLGLVLCLAPLVPVAATAAPGGAGVVINEAYLKGGSANQPFSNKFVELYNPTNATVSLAGWSIQYRSATGTAAFNGVGNLSGSIAPQGYYLVQMTSNGTTGAALPTPDAVTTVNPGGASGTLVLASTTQPLTVAPGSVSSSTPGVVDALGYGTSNTYETKAAVTGTANSIPSSYVRTAFADTDDNSADFTQQADVTPQNSGGAGTTPTDPGTPPTPQPEPTPEATVAIAQIQGTTDTSPYVDRVVTTRGVVTAAYATGGINGYYIQTPGTGGAIDLTTHVASDGMFVYSPSTASSVSVGDYIEVDGRVSEYFGLTQMTVTGAASLRKLDTPAAAVEPARVAIPATVAQRESLEGMLLAPQGDFTVADTYTTNQYGEVVLATGTKPLIQPTEVGRPGSPEFATAVADNAARRITLDDGQTTNFFTNKDASLSYLSNTNPVTVGAALTFTKPVVMDYRNSAYKLQPTSVVTGDTAYADLPVAFQNIRTEAPRAVGGDVKLASFNVLNYFTTTGDQLSGCTYYTDRAGAPVTVNSGCDARGAANAENLARQQAKIVTAITKLGADVVSLEEIENSARFGKDRDSALSTLVAALNAAAGSDVWDYPRSPAAQPANADVIRLAFIYKKAVVETVGDSHILIGSAAFSNARQPLAQAFKPVGGDADSTFVAIANHFKSKGSGSGTDADTGDGQGGSNGSRVNQANALVAFADEQKTAAGTDKVFLLGDFNSYTMEDPMEVLRTAGYVDLKPVADKYSYVFQGLSGSLDHVLASPTAAKAVTGVDIWNINSGEGIGLEYSRFNYNVKQLYAADQFRASDHDPVVVGVDLGVATVPTDPNDPGTPPTDPGTPPTDPGTTPVDPGPGAGQPAKPTTPPVAAPESALTAATLGLISIAQSVLTPGQTITVTVGQQYAGQWVSAWLYSTPVLLSDWQQVSAAGTIQVTIPADAPAGAHRIAVLNASGDVLGWTSVRVAATGDPTAIPNGASSALAYTGSAELTGWIALALLLMAMGGTVLVVRRRAS